MEEKKLQRLAEKKYLHRLLKKDGCFMERDGTILRRITNKSINEREKNLKTWDTMFHRYLEQICKPDDSSTKKEKRFTVPNSIKKEVKLRQKYKCYKCGKTLPLTTYIQYCIDYENMGATTIIDLIALCLDCYMNYQPHHIFSQYYLWSIDAFLKDLKAKKQKVLEDP